MPASEYKPCQCCQTLIPETKITDHLEVVTLWVCDACKESRFSLLMKPYLEHLRALPVDSFKARNETIDQIRAYVWDMIVCVRHAYNTSYMNSRTTEGLAFESWYNVLREIDSKLQQVTPSATSEEQRMNHHAIVL